MSGFNSGSLSLSSSHSLEIPLRSRSAVAFSGAVFVARVLDSAETHGRISEVLASGAARNLSQAIEQLNPSERNALQARWGRSLEELISLSNERDARVFHHGLLQVGRRLEDGDQVDLAGVVYSALVASAPPLPNPLPRGERGLTLPEAEILAGAQRRLNAIHGVGDWQERLAFSLQRIPNQATRWDVLLAMTGAGFTFRGFRLLTTASWAGSFESALALNAASASTAFLAETIAFTSLGKVAGALAGHPQDTSVNGIFNEWAGGAAMLLGLKGMGALTGAGVRSIYGEGVAATATGRLTQILAPQAGMFMGILVGNRLAEAGGFHPERRGDNWLVDGVTTLIEFNVAGNLQRRAGGPALTHLEARMEAMTRNIGHGSGRPGGIMDGRSKDRPLPGMFEWMSEHFRPEFVTPEGLPLPPFENRQSTIENPNAVFSVRLDGNKVGGNGGSIPFRGSEHPLLEMPKMGMKRGGIQPASRDRLVLENAERALRDLMPEGEVIAERLADRAYVADLLKSFGITQHIFDIESFRRGFQLSQENPERARQTGFDVDEVYLHWSLSLADIFRGGPARGVDALFHNTAPDLLNYQPFEASPGVKLNFFQRLWFHGIQGLLQGRMRQNIQLHPGVRAFQLGMRFGLGEDLTMVTTGPAGRVLILANEDPAMRMIYFGKTPGESVSIEEVRDASNIYTREHLVLAMRRAAAGQVSEAEVSQLRSYIETIRENPKKGEKLKHPAIAGILGKRVFSILVDDSSSTFRMLRDIPGFTVLQPPSARPGTLLNFVLGSKTAYLDRMANGYAAELADILSQNRIQSTSLTKESPAPENYPYQRFSIEIPWSRFLWEFVLPARELKKLGREIRGNSP